MEAAQLDGVGHWRVFRSVFLSLCRPRAVNLTVLCFVWSAQDFIWPSVLPRDTGMTQAAQAAMTVNTGLGASPTDVARYNASLVLLGIPALLIALVGMRFIVAGPPAGCRRSSCGAAAVVRVPSRDSR